MHLLVPHAFINSLIRSFLSLISFTSILRRRVYNQNSTCALTNTRLRVNTQAHTAALIPTSQSFKMQSRRWQHGSSGELDVFGATRYFAGRADGCATVAQPAAAERLTDQANVAIHDKRMAHNFRGQDDEHLGVHDRRHAQEELELAKITGKSKLYAFFGFMVSPSPGTSFRKRPPPTTNSSGSAAAGDEPTKPRESADDLITTSSASLQLEDYGYGFDLGFATGDTRLQGVQVVRGTAAGDEERWVVRCAPCWRQEEQQHAVTFYTASSHDHLHQLEDEGETCTNPGNWDSDSSSDLFDLDIE